MQRTSARRRRGLSASADGTISCPVRGESDVERCVGCPYLRAAEVRDGILQIDCRPIRTAVPHGEIFSALRL